MNLIKKALVTGASRGIGKAIARKLASEGYYVILVARNEAPLKIVLEEIQNAGGAGRIELCDVANAQSVYTLLETIEPFDVLVNNAGRSGGGVTAALDDALWHEVIQTNLNGVYYMTKGALHFEKIKKPAAIINIASTGGKQGVVFGAPYSAAKHGVVGFTKALGLELARHDITVNAVCPGFVETDLAVHVRENYSKIWKVSVEDAKKRIEERVPIGRYIVPAEVASMVSYLASPMARGITAQAINVCGGLGNY
jgi:ketoreductase